MHSNRRLHILDLAREKVAAMASVANPPTPKKVVQVPVPEAPKPAVPKAPAPMADKKEPGAE